MTDEPIKRTKEGAEKEFERMRTQKEKQITEEREHREQRLETAEKREQLAREDVQKEERHAEAVRERRDIWRKNVREQRREAEEQRKKRAQEELEEKERLAKLDAERKKKARYMDDLRLRVFLKKRKERLEALALEEDRALRKIDEELTRRFHENDAAYRQQLLYIETEHKKKTQGVHRSQELLKKRTEDERTEAIHKLTQEHARGNDQNALMKKKQETERRHTLAAWNADHVLDDRLRDIEMEFQKLRQEAAVEHDRSIAKIRSDIARQRKETIERIARSREEILGKEE